MSQYAGNIFVEGAEPTVWLERDGLVVMEAEKGTPESSDRWSVRTDVGDYQGDGFIRWEGPDYLSNKTHGVMVYRFRITNPGTYRLFLRSFHDAASHNKRPDEENDCWTNTALNSTTLIKTFRNGVLSGKPWSYRTQWTLADESFKDAVYTIPAGEHEFRLAARAQNFMIDRIFLVKGSDVVDVYLPESPINGVDYSDWVKRSFTAEVYNNPALENSVWGVHADPDKDGLVNGLEFYGNGNPNVSDGDTFYEVANGASSKTIRIRKGLNLSGVSLQAESSSDLSNWNINSKTEVMVGNELWEESTIVLSGSSPLFFRLKVILE